MFCQDCGAEIKENAVICVSCGVPISKNETNNMSIANNKPHISVPIISLILGIISIITFFDDSPWDYETIVGCIIMYSLPSIILGIISIARDHHGKGMGIAGLIMGIISLLGYIDLFSTIEYERIYYVL